METLYDALDQVLGLSQKAQDLSIAQTCLRAAIVFFVLLAAVRFGKKRFLGRATAFDTILAILIGSTAARAINANTSFFGTLAAVIVMIGLHWLVSRIARDWRAFSNLVKGNPTPLIKDGKVNRAALKRADMSDDDLDEDLRQEGVLHASEVKEARLERDGRLSVIKK
jgi:uncharacterized membrane protein YcaP (DUF421 family)